MIKRFYKDRLYIGIQDHCKDSCGGWVDVLSAKLCLGKPDSSWYDEIYEYSESKWNEIRERIKQQAIKLNREYSENDRYITSHPIWIHSKV